MARGLLPKSGDGVAATSGYINTFKKAETDAPALGNGPAAIPR